MYFLAARVISARSERSVPPILPLCLMLLYWIKRRYETSVRQHSLRFQAPIRPILAQERQNNTRNNYSRHFINFRKKCFTVSYIEIGLPVVKQESFGSRAGAWKGFRGGDGGGLAEGRFASHHSRWVICIFREWFVFIYVNYRGIWRIAYRYFGKKNWTGTLVLSLAAGHGGRLGLGRQLGLVSKGIYVWQCQS